MFLKVEKNYLIRKITMNIFEDLGEEIVPRKTEKENTEKFPDGKWIEISSEMEVERAGKKWQVETIISSEEDKMIYDTNNGVVAFIDGKGKMWVAPATPDRLEALKEQGYTEGGIDVPLSNGELPVNPVMREQWLRMMEEAFPEEGEEK